MRHLRSRASLSAALSAAVLLVGGAVHAQINPTFDVTVPNGGNTEFHYSIDIAPETTIMNETDAQAMGRPHGSVHASYFTIYDFNGYVAGSAFAPADWDISVQATGETPAGVTVPDTNVVNITFTYTGAQVIGPATHFEGTGAFGAVSTMSATKSGGWYSAYTVKYNPPTSSHPDNLTDQGARGHLVTPSAVPETSSLMLLLPGLVPLGVMIRRRSRK